jgi:hypothetical protein
MSGWRLGWTSAARAGALALMIVISAMPAACGGRGFFGKVYEYEEDLFLALDGSADLIVNASLPALEALRGLNVDDRSSATLRTRAREAYESPVTQVTRVSRPWRRFGRRYVQIRLHVADVRQLHQVAPLSWSTYEFSPLDNSYVFKQTVGKSELRSGTLQNVGWSGQELVAFRIHLPSRITWHNARDLETNETSEIQRGNILSWEQQLTDRLDSRPVEIEVRIEGQSILYRTIWLFVSAFAAAVLLIGLLVWLTMRKGAKEVASTP